jgi:hypothetical protein
MGPNPNLPSPAGICGRALQPSDLRHRSPFTGCRPSLPVTTARSPSGFPAALMRSTHTAPRKHGTTHHPRRMLGASHPYRSAVQACSPVQLGLRGGCPIWAARFAGCSHCMGGNAQAVQRRQATGPVAPAIPCATGNRAPTGSPRLALTLAQGAPAPSAGLTLCTSTT